MHVSPFLNVFYASDICSNIPRILKEMHVSLENPRNVLCRKTSKAFSLKFVLKKQPSHESCVVRANEYYVICSRPCLNFLHTSSCFALN